MQLESLMEGQCVDVELGLSCQTVKNEAGIAVLHHLGTGGQGMITVGGVLLQDADLQGGGAFHVAVAGPFLEIVGEKDLCPEKGTINHHAHFLDQEAVPGQTRGSNVAAAFNCVQMILERFCFLTCFLNFVFY